MKIKFYLLTFLIIIFFLEIIARNLTPTMNEKDELLGWRLIKNLDLQFNQKSLIGNKYLVNFQTNNRGSRFYGNEKNSEINVLVIGDSMTNGPYVSNDKTWFAYFAKQLELRSKKNVYIEAIGSGGYGNFQQYLLAKDILKNYDPDFVILQLCVANDFYNNTYEWETNSIIRNQYVRRPYLVNNKIKYYDGFLKYIYRSFFYENIKIVNRLDWILILFQSIFYNLVYDTKNASDIVKDSENLHKYKSNSILTTNNIFFKIKKLFPNKNIYSFNACKDGDIYPYDEWINISIQNDLIPLNFFKELNLTKNTYIIDGGHFNENGNKILGDALFKNLSKSQ